MDRPTDARSMQPPGLTAGRVERSEAGAPWWAYRRPRVTVNDQPVGLPVARPDAPPADITPVAHVARPSALLPTGRGGAVLVAGLVATTIIGTRVFGQNSLGVVLLPIAGVVAAMAFGQRCARLRPDEPWLPRLLLLGTIAKLTGSYLRYVTLTDAYGGVGDATRYDVDGRKFVAAWVGERASAPVLTDLRQTNFIRWLTGIVYYLFGQSLLGGFLLFGLLAMIGNYFWYRALVDAVPYANRRLFLLFMLFAPSVVFWPSSLGKEALMQLGVGALAWATSLLLNGHFPRAVPALLGGGWLLWVVRPHLLALVAVAGAAPYFVGQIRQRSMPSFVTRPIGMAVIGLMVVFAVVSGARYLGVNTFSLNALEVQLNDRTARSSEGGSAFSTGGSTLSPLKLPIGLVTVLFRPFPWEARSAFQLLASLESAALIALIFTRLDSFRYAFRRWRREPFLLYCVILLLLYGLAFSAFANFGLISRQRSLVLPALYALIAVQPPRLGREQDLDDARHPVRPGR